MGLFDDILKGLPVNPLLREKVAELEAKYAATETENAILRDDLREAKAENQKLKKQVEEFTHKDNLAELEIALLLLLAEPSANHYADGIASYLKEKPTLIEYYLDRLTTASYIDNTAGIVGGPARYFLTQKGREYLVTNNLL